MNLKPIPICPKYHISQDGNTILNTTTNHVLTQSEQTIDGKPTGYIYATLLFDTGEYTCKRIAVHRLVGLTWVHNPDPVNKVWINHRDGNRSHNHATNLRWSTISENIRHSFDVLGRKAPKGKDHWMYGKKVSKATKLKQSLSKLGKNHPKYRGIYIVFGRKYYSALECQRLTGICSKTVIRRCNNPKNVDYSFVLDPNREF